MPKHGSVLLYVHGNHKALYDGKPRTSTSTFTQLLNSDSEHLQEHRYPFIWLAVLWFAMRVHNYADACDCTRGLLSEHRNRVGTESCLWEKNPWVLRGAELESVLHLAVWFSTLPIAPPCLRLIVIIMYFFMCYSPIGAHSPFQSKEPNHSENKLLFRCTHTHRDTDTHKHTHTQSQ